MSEEVVEDLLRVVDDNTSLRKTIVAMRAGHEVEGSIENLKLSEAAKRALAKPSADPEPLGITESTPAPYPVNALGPILSGAARAMHEEIQVPLSLCGQSVLAAVAMCAQGHANVQPPHGRPHPISLFAITTGTSGDRKSSADKEAMEPIQDRERELEEAYPFEKQEYDNSVDAYEEARKAAKGKSKDKGQASIKTALDATIHPEDPPLTPLLLCEDPTVEGIYRSLKGGQPSQGCFTDEAGLLIGGHALNGDNFIKTISRLSKLWDGGSFDRTRGGDERDKLHDRRFSLHWLVQPMVAAELFSRHIAEAQGFFPRCLLAIPDSLAGTRFHKATRVDARPELGIYRTKLTSLLKTPLPEVSREHKRPAIGLDSQASARYAQFFDSYEMQLGPSGDLSFMQPFVSRLAEQGLRIAAVIHMVEHGSTDTPIGMGTLNNGFRLAEFSLQEWIRLKQQSVITTDIRDARALLEWAHEQPDLHIHSRQIQQYGPNHLRTKKAWEKAVSTLVEYGWFEPVPDGMVIDDAMRRRVWKVVREQ